MKKIMALTICCMLLFVVACQSPSINNPVNVENTPSDSGGPPSPPPPPPPENYAGFGIATNVVGVNSL